MKKILLPTLLITFSSTSCAKSINHFKKLLTLHKHELRSRLFISKQMLENLKKAKQSLHCKYNKIKSDKHEDVSCGHIPNKEYQLMLQKIEKMEQEDLEKLAVLEENAKQNIAEYEAALGKK